MILKYLPEELVCENGGQGIEKSQDAQDMEQPEAGGEGAEPLRRLEQLEGLDVKTGLTYCMNEEDFYIEMLQEFLQADKASQLKHFLAEEDWDNYRTTVHALKSTSLTIGAAHLSGEAKALEMAAKEGNMDYIRSHHDGVMDEYKELTDHLKEILENGAETSV